MALNLGGVIRLTYAVRNDVAALVNPSTATLTITQPDGTIAAGTTVTLPPAVTGQLVVDFIPTQAGLHSVHWATTVPTTSEDDVFVAERPASLLVGVDEAVAHLRAVGIITSDADREQLQWLCLVATDAVERDLGRTIVRRAVVETYSGGYPAIALRQTPVLSITSVVESGVTLTSNDYVLDVGMLYRGTTIAPRTFVWGRLNVAVSYIAGYTDPPRIIRKAALNTLQGMWQESQQAAHPAMAEFAAGSTFVNTGSLTPVERDAYESLRAVGVA